MMTVATDVAVSRRNASLDLDRLAGEIDGIADRWAVGRPVTVADLEQVRVALEAAHLALRVLVEPR